MTAKEMANATGWSLHTVYKYARLGILKTTKTGTQPADYDESGVQILLDMRETPIKIEKKPEPVVVVEKKPTLREKVVELMKYNEQHGTCYSYGQATAYNII